MWNPKRIDTNELTYKTETDSQTQKMNLQLTGGRDSKGVWESHVDTAIFQMHKQQGLSAQHMELLVLCASLDEMGVWKDGYMYM